MKKKIILFFSICFFLNSLIFANYKLAVLDFDKIFKNSVQYQKIIYSINYDLYQKYLVLNHKINNLIKEKNRNKYFLYNTNKFKEKENYFKNETKNIFHKIIKLEKYINDKNISIHNFFILKIKKIISSLIKNNKYDIIFDSNSIFYYNKNISDITNIIIKKIS